MRKLNEGTPFNFVHDINDTYFRFHNFNWFYNDPGYSWEMTKRAGYRLDGQVFYKKIINKNGTR